ncbi:MAG: MFS transporter [Pseudolabrys sp.]|nr:MFS transporter [Pseudolabrys sp.]
MALAAPTDRALTRVIVVMSLACFASGASMRVTDPLLPQVALDFNATVGAASWIVTAYVIPYGLTQAFSGAIGDRLGKCQAVALACALSAILVVLCAFAQSLPQLTLLRLVAAPGAAIIVPLGMAYIGDVIPYERRQPVLARFLAGAMAGMLSGQLIGGIVGDYLGWRYAFIVLAGVFAVASIALFSQFRSNPWTKPVAHADGERPQMIPSYRKMAASSWCRFLIITVFLEGAIMFGTYTYVGADLHTRFGLSFTAVGLVVATFGIGSIVYAMLSPHILRLLGERKMVVAGGFIVAVGFLVLAGAPVWQLAPAAGLLLGFGYYMVHNTIQTKATQMLPEARGNAIAAFSCALFVGQSVGVAFGSVVVDYQSAPTLFALAAAGWLAMALWATMRLARQHAAAKA